MRFVRTFNPSKTYDWSYSTKLRDALIGKFRRNPFTKEHLPLLHLESVSLGGGDRHLICIDLDKVFNILPVSAYAVAERLKMQWPAVALSPSATGVKIFIAIQGDLPSNAADFSILKEEVKEQFFGRQASRRAADPIWNSIYKCWDDAVVSLTRCFADHEIGAAAVAGASLGVQVVRWGTASRLESRTIVSNLDTDTSPAHRFNPYTGTLPSGLSEFIGVGNESKGREALLRIFLNVRRLQESFDLPQKKLAHELNTSISMVNKWLKELKQRGWLRCTDHSYCPGVKAKTFKAVGPLLYAIQKTVKPASGTKALPNQVEDGKFYQQMLSALWYFQSDESFLSWLQKLRGLTPSRLKEGTRYARSHYRKLARSGGESTGSPSRSHRAGTI